VENKGVLTKLRLMRPARTLALSDAKRVAERQASKLLHLRDALEAPMPEEVVTHLIHIRVSRANLGSLSGVSHWNGAHWQIAINSHHALVRQRFTIGHEFFHVLDAPYKRVARVDHAEEVADYFAASLLMPKRLVKRLWASGLQDTRSLARYFNVSISAMRWRLDELHLDDAADTPRLRGRCGGVVSDAQLQAIKRHEGAHEYPLI
jgi:Zn-dependent peptidase ImmA (M78 family)